MGESKFGGGDVVHYIQINNEIETRRESGVSCYLTLVRTGPKIELEGADSYYYGFDVSTWMLLSYNN